MITSVFNKTRPLNYLLLGLAITTCFVLYFVCIDVEKNIGLSIACWGITLVSFVLINFTTLKNSLTQNNNYTILLYFIGLLFFPETLNSPNILFANFFILLALRRLISIRSMKSIKEKIFDASLWILIATLFHFWSIIFILMVFTTVALDVSKDYKNWFIPFVALGIVTILVIAINLLTEGNIGGYLQNKMTTDFNFMYFKNTSQNIAFALFSAIVLFSFINSLLILNKKPMSQQPSIKRIMMWFLISILIFVVSPSKNNSLLLFTLAPISIITAQSIEIIKNKAIQETNLVLLLISGLVFFIMSCT